MAERVEESHDWRETGWWEAEGVSELVRRKTGGGGAAEVREANRSGSSSNEWPTQSWLSLRCFGLVVVRTKRRT